MFIEPRVGNKSHVNRKGWIEVICGSMFSGKTEELIRRLNRAKIARQKIEIFKPTVDKRYHEEDVVSHNANAIRSTPIDFAQDMLLLGGSCDVVGIDEAQFFDEGLAEVCVKLANSGVRVIAAGLDMDYLGKPFGPMPALMAVAEYVTKVHAVCVQCGDIANYSFRNAADEKQVLLGETDSYEARCRHCFTEGLKQKQS
ncbi:thymidine kinase [Pontibacter anaerobius]|uniref:Thymidine kinase n=1 Tax=Pontibacter anaerobius TaxID=2993940 RepID=A0ABT3RA37_9BACT|nr:thymidine kinase [Pontibacter anaerobius]MCX2738376.1 thymidine kinase [Pontibacter anaerobius]